MDEHRQCIGDCNPYRVCRICSNRCFFRMDTNTVQLTSGMTVDIDTLPAGREMDALVAEKVMKWYPRTQAEYKNSFPLTSGTLDAPMEYLEWSMLLLKPYSTSISAAWNMLEKAQDLLDCHAMLISTEISVGWLVQLCGCRSDGSKDYGVADMKGTATALTAPLAICRAALKAMLKQ